MEIGWKVKKKKVGIPLFVEAWERRRVDALRSGAAWFVTHDSF